MAAAGDSFAAALGTIPLYSSPSKMTVCADAKVFFAALRIPSSYAKLVNKPISYNSSTMFQNNPKMSSCSRLFGEMKSGVAVW